MPNDAQFGEVVWKSPKVSAPIRAYETCLRTAAEATRPQSDLGLERVEAVIAACAAENEAAAAAIRAAWSEEPKQWSEGRVRGLRLEARRVVRETPYVPPTVEIQTPAS